MLGAVPIRTWLNSPVEILPSALGREGIPKSEDGITSKGSHQSTISLLHLAQFFLQIDEFFALDINKELPETRNLFKQFTLLVVMFPISKSDTVSIV